MKNAKEYQILFFEKLKESKSENINPVYDIANLLEISIDAAYRRLRGKTLLDFHEIIILCKYYNISIDEYVSANPYEVKFQYMPIKRNDFMENYKIYMKSLRNYLKSVVNDPSKHKQILFAATDIPIFHLCKFPILKAFKVYTWHKLFEKSDDSKFSSEDIISSELVDIFKDISELYDKIDSIEIWTSETIDTFLGSIKYFYEIGYFHSSEDVALICDQLNALMEVLKQYGEKGYKQVGNNKSTFQLFLSETDLENNLIYAETDNSRICFIKLYSINTISTSNDIFCKEIKLWFDSIINKSILISGFSQKQFVLFFKDATRKINNLKNSLMC
ncbi:MAG: hypothetical protein LBT25_11045 [Candidatus Symbiothrix sp.]|jgi:hypothetical protein|nr:hypothetical protein [Candidatus Symbiothrix sp.]